MAIIYDYDYILENYLGSAGWWQFRQFFMLILVKWIKTTPYLLHLFTAYTPAHRCLVPECDDQISLYEEPWTNFSIPKVSLDSAGSTFLRAAETMSSCEMFSSMKNVTRCEVNSFSNSSYTSCESFKFDRSLYLETVTTRFSLVCDEAYKRSLLDSVTLLGSGLGYTMGIMFGDRLGRRPLILCGSVAMAVFTTVPAFVDSAELYILLRFCSSIAIYICSLPAHIMIMELYSPKHRTVAFGTSSFFETFMCVVLGVVAYFERDWRRLHLWIGLPCIPVSICLWLFFHESVRWKIVNNKELEAKQDIELIAKANGQVLCKEKTAEIAEIIHVIAYRSKETVEDKRSVMNIFQKPFLSRTLILGGAWVTNIWAYFGLILNSGSLSGDIFLNYCITWLLDIPVNAYLALALDSVGRRKTISFGLFGTGCTCLALTLVPKTNGVVTAILFQVAKLFGSLCIYTFTLLAMELYPTTIRVRAASSLCAISRLLGSITPFILMLEQFWPPLPLLILAIPSVLFGFGVLIIPETTGTDLPENVKDIREASELQKLKSGNTGEPDEEKEDGML